MPRAKRTLTASEADDAIAYVQKRASATGRASGVWKCRQEARLTARLFRIWSRQQAWLIEHLRELKIYRNGDEAGATFYRKNIFEDQIKDFIARMPGNDEVAATVVATAGASYRKGARDAVAKLELARLGVTWKLVNKDAEAYLLDLKTLNLSDYKGSISRETKKKIIRILADGAETGATYTDMAREIKAQGDAGVFSRARGQLIAVTEVGNAYAEGNLRVVDKAQTATGQDAYKRWSTAGGQDNCEVCLANEAEGWQPLDHVYGSGHTRPLAHPHCYCDEEYQLVAPGEQPE